MTEPIVQRLRESAAALPAERVSMQTLAQAHAPTAHGMLLLLMAVPCLLPVPGVGAVLGLGMAALFVTAGLMLMSWIWGSEWITRWVSM